jgi:hypothetical protein
MNHWIDEILAAKMFEPCTTHCPTAAPVFFVPKKDGTKRLVIDYQRLNNCTIQDSYPLPCIDQLMDRVRGAKWFSKFNLKSGYNQIRACKGDEWKTAFMTHQGPFQLNIMAFGFINAPACFQCFMDDYFFQDPQLSPHMVGYLDDANTFHQDFDQHVQTNWEFLRLC